jgi:Co/Zn/Cd efflux system component
MNKTTYTITKMDCPSEEQIIRMKLEPLQQVQQLEFDIPARKLDVYHGGEPLPITAALESLNLGSSLTNSNEAFEAILPATDDARQRKLLWQVLAINFFFFLLEMITGFVSQSMGLVADSLDMLADSIVYGLALFAVGAAASRKMEVAKISGYFQLVLAILGFAEVLRRFFGYGEVPEFMTMIIISAMALAGNALCFYLLQKSKSREAHMQASLIFTSNDVVVNLGVIVAGILVYLTSSKTPDLVIGILVFAIVARGAFKILKLAS